MGRIVTSLLVAGLAGVLGWWANQRGIARKQATALMPSKPHDSPAAAPGTGSDDAMIIVPRADIDPHMVKPAPDIDPKMVVTPPWPAPPRADTGNAKQL